jgi:hypothetical protein
MEEIMRTLPTYTSVLLLLVAAWTFVALPVIAATILSSLTVVIAFYNFKKIRHLKVENANSLELDEEGWHSHCEKLLSL